MIMVKMKATRDHLEAAMALGIPVKVRGLLGRRVGRIVTISGNKAHIVPKEGRPPKEVKLTYLCRPCNTFKVSDADMELIEDEVANVFYCGAMS